MPWREQVQAYRVRVEAALDRWLPSPAVEPCQLHEAMRYAVLGPGKRFRPILVYASGEAMDAAPTLLERPACAVEMIHAYSMIHDDLPAMDDDDLRRGRPTCHHVYGEATAILAGDALQALAFDILTRNLADDAANGLVAAQRLRTVETLAAASGPSGMVGGQALDLAATGNRLERRDLEQIHRRKTGALIRASVELGASFSASSSNGARRKLRRFAECLGLAYQIHDDVLDVEGSAESLGKRNSDRQRRQPTYAALLGAAGARQAARELCREALAALDGFDRRKTALLRRIAAYAVHRKH